MVAPNRVRHGAGGDAARAYAGRLKECAQLSPCVSDAIGRRLRRNSPRWRGSWSFGHGAPTEFRRACLERRSPRCSSKRARAQAGRAALLGSGCSCFARVSHSYVLACPIALCASCKRHESEVSRRGFILCLVSSSGCRETHGSTLRLKTECGTPEGFRSLSCGLTSHAFEPMGDCDDPSGERHTGFYRPQLPRSASSEVTRTKSMATAAAPPQPVVSTAA